MYFSQCPLDTKIIVPRVSVVEKWADQLIACLLLRAVGSLSTCAQSVPWCCCSAGTSCSEGHHRSSPTWAPTLPAGRRRSWSTSASWPTWWQPWTWRPTAWPHPMATGRGPPGAPGPTRPGSPTGRCRCRRGGAASPGSPPSRPSGCPSRMQMWGNFTMDLWLNQAICGSNLVFNFLQDCVQLNQYRLAREIGKVIRLGGRGSIQGKCCCRASQHVLLLCRARTEWWS